MDAEIGVIGIGTMGSMAMWQLARKGVSVIGFDQFGIGHDRSAGGGESRIFRTIGREDYNSFPLVQEALHQWRELESETNSNLLTMTNGLLIGDPNVNIIQNALKSIKKYNLDHEVLDNKEANKRYPQHRLFSNEIMIIDKVAGYLRPELAIISAVKRAQELGAVIKDYSRVQKVTHHKKGVTVIANNKEYKFNKVLVTTGPWTSELFSNLQNTITARRLISTWFTSKTPSFFNEEHFPVFSRSTDDKYFYGVPSIDGSTVKISKGTKLEDQIENPRDLNRDTDINEINDITKVVKEYLPDLIADPTRINVYMESYTPDKKPIIGKSPWSNNIILASGFSGHGFKYAPAIGKVVGDMLLERDTEHSINQFSPNRF